MKKKSFILFSVITCVFAFTSCLGLSKEVIKSPDGSQRVDLIGTWEAKASGAYFEMIFDRNGSFTYGCGYSGGPAQISMDSFGGLVSHNKFNVGFAKGTFKIHGNILTAHWKETKDFKGSSGLRAGSDSDFIVNIVSPDKLIIQTSNTGNTRTYTRR